MKKLLAVAALCAASGMAASLTGFIMDKTCASKGGMVGNEECAKSCIGRGDAAVLVTDEGKILAVANQDKVKKYAGKKVAVTGKVDGDKVTVDTIALPKS